MGEPELWERQKGESHKAFQAFHEYCLMGDSRSIRGVSKKLNKSVALLGRWSSKWNWKDRAVSYDNALVRQEMETARAEILEMRKKQIEIGRFFQSKGIDAIREKVNTQEKLVSEDLRDLLSLVTKGMQIETEARMSGFELTYENELNRQSDGIKESTRTELDEFFKAK